MPPRRKNRKGDSDSDDEPVRPAAAAASADAGGGGKKKKDRGAPAAAAKSAPAKGRRGDDSDDDGLAAMRRLAEKSESDEEEVPVVVVRPAAPVKSKDKKKDKAAKGRRGDDDSDDDALAEMRKLAAEKSESEEEEKEEEEVVVERSSEKKKKSKDKTKDKKKSSKDRDRDEEGEGATGSANEEEEEDAGKSSKSDKKKKSKKREKDEEPVYAEPQEAVARAVAAAPVAQQQAVVPAAAPAPVVAPAPAAAVAAPAAAAEEVKAAKKPMSKLEMKLAASKREREAALAAAAEAAKNAPPPPPPAVAVSDVSSKMGSLKIEDDVKLSEEELVEKANLESTMFGDEVFDEDLPEARAKKASQMAAMKASAEGAQFAVSQSAINENDPQWMNALDIVIPNFSISAHNKELFYNAELNIAQGRRYGLVGPNGAGKSTILKMISAGELKVPPRVDYLYVEQEVMADETPAVEAVLRADKERWELVQEEREIMAALEKGPSDALDERLGEVHELLENINASAAESKARRILFGLGFDAEMQVRPTKFFSGGWRMRISLARALFIEPTLLMLDEPTNHLDLNAVIWLDDYLQKWKKTLLIVSHDQDFLNSVCEEILHLDEKKLRYYKGNYDSFKEQEETARKQRQKDWEKQEKRLRELKSKGQTKASAEKTVLKSKSREPGARAAKKMEAANAASGIESAESKIELIKRPKEYTVTFTFPEVSIINPPILEVRDVNFRYSPRLPWLFRGLNFGLDMHSRVCIVGPNGSGKSTILKIITGELNPPDGEVRRNPRLRVGVYNQHFIERLPMDEDPVTYLRRLFNDQTYQSARNMLGRYGLEGHAHTIPIRDLSGGQKARVVFCELSLMAPHLLFLDEPTNNLDIESIDALCDALRLFNGGVILVSHDARLIETTECQLWVVENQNITPWESGFTGYRQHLLNKLEEQMSIIIAGGGERPK